LQALGNAEYAAVQADILAEHDRARILAERRAERVLDRLNHGHRGHRDLRVARRTASLSEPAARGNRRQRGRMRPGAVTSSRLATQLRVSAPSVTSMLRTLARERMIAYAPRAGARLTAAGRREALRLVRRHRILETFLVQVLGIDWADVHEDAE